MAYFNKEELIQRSRIIESNLQKSYDSFYFSESQRLNDFDIFLSHSKLRYLVNTKILQV